MFYDDVNWEGLAQDRVLEPSNSVHSEETESVVDRRGICKSSSRVYFTYNAVLIKPT